MAKTRITNQRLKILQYLKKVKTHPRAEEVYEKIKAEMPAISLATVYRNLNRLAEEGEILRLEINKEYHYDGDKCSHQHCLCKKCGIILDVFQKDISEYALSKIKSEGFQPSCVTIMFNGVCKNCLKKGDKNVK